MWFRLLLFLYHTEHEIYQSPSIKFTLQEILFAMDVFAMTVFVSNDPLLFSFFNLWKYRLILPLAAEVATHSIFGYMISYVNRNTCNLGQPAKRRRERKGSLWLSFFIHSIISSHVTRTFAEVLFLHGLNLHVYETVRNNIH